MPGLNIIGKKELEGILEVSRGSPGAESELQAAPPFPPTPLLPSRAPPPAQAQLLHPPFFYPAGRKRRTSFQIWAPSPPPALPDARPSLPGVPGAPPPRLPPVRKKVRPQEGAQILLGRAAPWVGTLESGARKKMPPLLPLLAGLFSEGASDSDFRPIRTGRLSRWRGQRPHLLWRDPKRAGPWRPSSPSPRLAPSLP